jgi:hypothetical protein
MELIEVIGALAMVYALLSVLASALKEVIEARLQQRKQGLKSALEDLLTLQGAAALVGHAAIDVVNNASATQDPANHRNWPSYLDPNTFARTVYALEMTEQIPKDTRLGKALDALKVPDSERINAMVAIYNERMDRLQGTFKRQSQKVLLLIGLVLAAALNVDTIGLAQELQRDPVRREMLVAMAQTEGSQASLQAHCGAGSLPAASTSSEHLIAARPLADCVAADLTRAGLGWQPSHRKALAEAFSQGAGAGLLALLIKLFGYVLTALAVSLGAPFWFDLMSKVANLRATLKPFASSGQKS